MSIETALRKIRDDLARIAREEELDRSEIDLAVIRLGTQIEMIEMGLDKVEPSQ